MRRRPYSVFFLLPAVAYLTLLFAVAVLVVHPSALGWAGFGVVAAVVLAIGAGVSRLFPRSRTNPPALRAPADGRVRLLVVDDLHCDAATLCRAVEHAVAGRPAEVYVVAPVLASPLHFLTDDEHAEIEDARARLTEALEGLERLGIRAHGSVGADDPLQAVGDVLAVYPAGEVLLAAPGEERRNWLEHDLERRVREAYGLRVSSLALETAVAPAVAG
jgi:hypothetical protein